ncbi:MAG: MBG domain-containing protein [Lachnospiraceae bacterium]|nr:MBG domain-containing protein [Lachnospiraceae bacterium]
MRNEKRNFNIRRRAKETLAMFLSILLVFSVVLVPIKADADEYDLDSLDIGSWVMGDDTVNGNEAFCRIIYTVEKELGDGIYVIEPVNSGDSKGEDEIYYQYGEFVFPEFAGTPKLIGDKNLRAVYKLDSVNADDTTGGLQYKFVQYDGFRIRYLDEEEEVEAEDWSYFYGSGGVYFAEKTAPEKTDYIGWATSSSYIDMNNSEGFFVLGGNPIRESDLEEVVKYLDLGVLDLYPIPEKLDTKNDWDIEVTGYTLGPDGSVPDGGPGVRVAMGDTRDSDYEFVILENYEDPSDTSWHGTSDPTIPGKYKAVLTVGETETVINSDGQIESRGYEGFTLDSEPFIVSMIADGEIIPAENLEYNGAEQALVDVDADYEDSVVFSDAEDGTYSSAKPTGKNADTYTFWWKVLGDGVYQMDSEPKSETVTIAPKEITGIAWSEEEFVYNGEGQHPTATVNGVVSGDSCEALYTIEGRSAVDGVAKNAGSYTIGVTGLTNDNYALPSGETYTKNFTIEKADVEDIVWPDANDLTYNGNNQALVSGGDAGDGTFVYRLSETGEYSETVPTGKTAEAYVVRVKVSGDENHLDSDEEEISVTIAPKTVGLEWDDAELSYTGEEQCISASLTGVVTGDVCTVTIEGGGTDAGTYTAEATALSNSNYELPAENTRDFHINPAEITIATDPAAKPLTYDGTEQELVTAGVSSSEFGKIRYRLTDEDGQALTEYSYDIPVGKNAGTYHVGYDLVSLDDNHSCAVTGVVDVTIEKVDITPAVRIGNWTYGQEPNTPVLTGNTGNGTVSYSYKLKTAGEDAYTAGLPSSTLTAGEYTLKAVIGETDNYNAGEATADFTVEKADISPSIAFSGFTYGETPDEPVVTGNTGNGAVTYSYRKKSDLETESVAGLPGSTTAAGDYTLTATIAETDNYPSATAEVDFTIAKADFDSQVSITGWKYGETPSTPVITDNISGGAETIEYKASDAADSTYDTEVPTEAGDYKVRATIAETDNYNASVSYADFSISKEEISPSVTMADWVYGTTASDPVVSGNTGNGTETFRYKAASDTTYSDRKPSDAGQYTVKVEIAETDNYEGASATAEFEITRADITPSVSITGWTYGDAPATPTVFDNLGDGEVTYAYRLIGGEDTDYVSGLPTSTTNAGDYVLRATIAESDNYNGAEATAEFTVAKADCSISETSESLIYNGSGQKLIGGLSVIGGTPMFALGQQEEGEMIEPSSDAYSSEIPVKTDAGEYYVWLRVDGDQNHNDVTPSVRTVTIAKASNSLTVPKKVTLTYNGKMQPLVSGVKADFGSVYYGLEKSGNYSDSVPEGKDAKSYTVWCRVIGGGNYEDVEPVSVEVEIQKKTVGLKWSDLTFKYDGKKHVPTLTLTGVADGDTCRVTVEGETSEVGTHTAKAVKLSNSNYELPSSATVKFTIGSSLPTIKTAPAAKELTENGNYQELVTAGEVENGTLLYSLSEKDGYSTEIPKGKDAGTYTVWYKVNGNTIDGKQVYDNIAPASVSVTIAKKPDEKKEDNTVTVKPGSVSISVNNAIYGGNTPTPVVSSSTNDASKAVISYKPAGAPDSAFTGAMPTEVGTYVAVVSLPENNEYSGCSASCTFSISYMPVPEGAYTISGTIGAGGWYTSEVTLVPATGYQISVKNRQNFTNQAITLSEEDAGSSFFIRNAATGEQSAAIQIAALRIDVLKPQIHDMEEGGTYFTDEKGVLKGSASDKNLDQVRVDGNIIKTETDGNGNVTFDLPSGKRKQKVKVTVVDKAGNEVSMDIITAPEWMKTGVIREGDLFLEADTEYKTPTGSSTWTKEGDDTTYMPGISFYSEEGDATFHENK